MNFVVIFIVVQVVVAGIVIFILNHLLNRELIDAALEKLQATLSSEKHEIIIKSASELNNQIKSRIENTVNRKSKGATVIYEVHSELKSGLSIQLGETVLDFSLTNRLKNLSART